MRLRKAESSRRKWIFGILYMGLILMTIGMSMHGICGMKRQQDIAEKILRFHVRANSDSSEDQELKLKVRDAIGVLMEDYLSEADDLEDCKEKVEAHMDEIVHTAEQVIAAEGKDYPVEAYLDQVDFPVKTYGSYTFPAGRYEALEVVIGAGTGHNWWCVMYPNMCFTGSVYEVIDEKSEEALQATLTEEEYESLLEEKNYKVSFRYLDFLEKFFEN